MAPFALSSEPSRSKQIFLVERPTRADFALFRDAIRRFFSNNTLRYTLGGFVAAPHLPDDWFVSEDGLELYKALSDTSYLLHRPTSQSCVTRHGTRFEPIATISGLIPRHTRASVLVSEDADLVTLHSSAKCFVPVPHKCSFLEKLAALPNQSLWRTLEIDSDGSWIYGGFLRNTLVMMSDGSYNSHLALDVCSCAAIIHRTDTGQRAKVTWVEKSDPFTADNYRAELLGGIALQLMLQVAVDGKFTGLQPKPRFGCDNRGVVHHGNHPCRPMPEKQAQADVLRYYKRLVRDAP